MPSTIWLSDGGAYYASIISSSFRSFGSTNNTHTAVFFFRELCREMRADRLVKVVETSRSCFRGESRDVPNGGGLGQDREGCGKLIPPVISMSSSPDRLEVVRSFTLLSGCTAQSGRKERFADLCVCTKDLVDAQMLEQHSERRPVSLLMADRWSAEAVRELVYLR